LPTNRSTTARASGACKSPTVHTERDTCERFVVADQAGAIDARLDAIARFVATRTRSTRIDAAIAGENVTPDSRK
jgi:hypothetical protein